MRGVRGHDKGEDGTRGCEERTGGEDKKRGSEERTQKEEIDWREDKKIQDRGQEDKRTEESLTYGFLDSKESTNQWRLLVDFVRCDLKGLSTKGSSLFRLRFLLDNV